MGSKVRAQERDRFGDAGLVHDRTFSDSFRYTRGAVTIRAQRPDNVIGVFVLIPFVERERFEDQERENVSDLHLNILLDTTFVERISRQRDRDIVSRSQLHPSCADGGNPRTDTGTRIPLQATTCAITHRAEELERDRNAVDASLPSEGHLVPSVRIAPRRETAFDEILLKRSIRFLVVALQRDTHYHIEVRRTDMRRQLGRHGTDEISGCHTTDANELSSPGTDLSKQRSERFLARLDGLRRILCPRQTLFVIGHR
jgi:hypothetical protein